MPKDLTPRERVNLSLNHIAPDRCPVDFLATPEVWQKMHYHFEIPPGGPCDSEYFDREWEEVLQALQVDCRVISFDQFFQPPDWFYQQGDRVNWWESLGRSTPCRMYRRINKDGDLFDLWGHHMRVVRNPTGAYEEFAGFPLRDASLNDVRNYPWPQPDWWDFSPIPDVIMQLDADTSYHIRFRTGSIFEAAWQLCGLDQFLMDLATDPEVPLLIMDYLTDLTLVILDKVLAENHERLDMVYFYDDVATQNGLLISRGMWKQFIQPRHASLIDIAKKYDKKVMYHCDGSIYPIIPDLIEMGIDVLNPIQVDARDMGATRLKDEFGDQLCFHGAVDNIQTLPFGTPQAVKEEVRERIRVLGRAGGYILASTHHIQSNTPPENVIAMYDMDLRYL